MASKRFLIVPEDSSAASKPLPGATMARAIVLRSARFIDASSESTVSLQVKVDGSQANPRKTSKRKSKQENANKRARAPARPARSGVAAGHATFGSSSPLT